MTPNLVDKLLDALGLLPFGAILRLRRVRALWRRLKGLRATLDRIADQLRRAEARVRRVRERMRRLAHRRDELRVRIDQLRVERRHARSSVEQRHIDDRIRRADRELDQIMDDMGPAFDEITDAEAGLTGVQARQREYDFLGQEILNGLAEFFLPMALISCVAHTLGIDLFTRAESIKPGPYRVDGEFARYDGTAYTDEMVVLCRAHRPVAWSITDGSGRFEFAGLPPGEYTAAGMCETLCMRRFTIESEDCSIQLGPVEHLPHVIMVQDENGKPAKDVVVVMVGFSIDRVESFALGETHVRGTVCLPRHPTLNSAILVYRTTEHSVTLLHSDIMAADNKPYSKVRIRSHLVRATVLNAHSGEPISGVQVTALPVDGDAISGISGRVAGFRATTDASGSFEAYCARPGRHMLSISARGYKLVVTEMKVHEEKSSHIGTFKLKRSRETTALLGCIRNPAGQPSGGYVSLVLVNGNPTGYRTFADETGTFHFKGLPPGEMIIEVQGERPSELGRRKITLHPNKTMEAIITLKHALDFE